MIDIPLRERQFGQVLGFLDEQLGDNDVTIIFGDAADGRAYLVSNRTLNYGKKFDGLYVKDLDIAQGFDYDLSLNMASPGPHYTFQDEENELALMHFWGVGLPFAFAYSQEFIDLLANGAPVNHVLLPDDVSICHEAAHGIVHRYGFVRRSEALEEALVQKTFVDYASQTYPDAGEFLDAFAKDLDADPLHKNALRLARDPASRLRLGKLQQYIKRKNMVKNPS